MGEKNDVYHQNKGRKDESFQHTENITQNFTNKTFDQLSILMTHVKCVVVFMAQMKQLLVFEKIASVKPVSTQFMINQSMGFQESVMFVFNVQI